jgi:uncharacterized membrane protein HdeD (DUF308 family)
MERLLTANWWALLIRGIAALILGIFALGWPGPTLVVLVLLFGAYAFVDGVFAIVSAVRARTGEQAWLLVLEGLAGLAVGVLTYAWPSATALSLYALVAIWAIVTGILEIIAAAHLRRRVQREVLLVFAGVCSIAFGILMVVVPRTGVLALAFLIGVYGILFGVSMIALAFRLHHLRRAARVPPPHVTPQPV